MGEEVTQEGIQEDIRQFVEHASIGPKVMKVFDVPPNVNRITHRYQIQNSVDDGFIRLYTMLGHRYWIAQAEHRHATPDWKLHFSVDHEHIPLAWNLIAFRLCRWALRLP